MIVIYLPSAPAPAPARTPALAVPWVGLCGEKLTPRETEVLRLLAQGFTNPEIAKALMLSVRTVESHRVSIGQKLQTQRRRDFYALAKRCGLV